MHRKTLLLLAPLLIAATPDTATYHQEADEIFYWLVISDTHVDATPESGEEAPENLKWATSTLFDTVLPTFMVNCGDLTDATGGGLIPLGQQDMEWESYQAIVDGNGMTDPSYIDMPGNHDQYLDGELLHYLDYSVSGRAEGTTNHAWTYQVNGTKYLFIAVASAASDGLPFPEDTVGLDGVDLAFLEETLEKHGDADILTVFSHHPAAYYLEAKEVIYDVLNQEGATAFIHGHTHGHSITWQQGTLHFENGSLGKSSQDQIGLFAYDGRGLSAIAFDVGDWPQVMITAPLDGKLGKSHKYDYMVPDSLAAAPVRALAFDPTGITAVSAVVDDGGQSIELTAIGDRLWQGDFDATQLDSGPHQLTVTATAAGGTTADHQITFYVIHDDAPVEPPVVEIGPEPVPDVIEQPEEDATSDLSPASDLGTDSEVWVPGTTGDALGAADAGDDVGPKQPGVSGYIKHSDDGCRAGDTGHRNGLWLLVLAWLVMVVVRRRAGTGELP